MFLIYRSIDSSIRWAKAEEERLQQEAEERAREAEEAVKRAIGERERAREVAEQERMAEHDEDVGEEGGCMRAALLLLLLSFQLLRLGVGVLMLVVAVGLHLRFSDGRSAWGVLLVEPSPLSLTHTACVTARRSPPRPHGRTAVISSRPPFRIPLHNRHCDPGEPSHGSRGRKSGESGASSQRGGGAQECRRSGQAKARLPPHVQSRRGVGALERRLEDAGARGTGIYVFSSHEHGQHTTPMKNEQNSLV